MLTHALIREEAEKALAQIMADRQNLNYAVNWGDLSVHDVERCEGESGHVIWRVTVEEGSSDAFEQDMMQHLRHLVTPTEDVQVVTEW